MERPGDPNLFDGLADFEMEFFADLIRSYSKLDLGMRGFFYHRIKQVVQETIALLRSNVEAELAVEEEDDEVDDDPTSVN